MVFSLEALQAFHGDALILHAGEQLVLIDGGPVNTYPKSLRPRLEELRAKRAPGGALRIDLAMVSHIDEDERVAGVQQQRVAVEGLQRLEREDHAHTAWIARRASTTPLPWK